MEPKEPVATRQRKVAKLEQNSQKKEWGELKELIESILRKYWTEKPREPEAIIAAATSAEEE